MNAMYSDSVMDFTVPKSAMLTLVHILTRKMKSQAVVKQETSRPSDGFSSMLPAIQTNIINLNELTSSSDGSIV